MESVKAECDSCGGTGVYCGFAERGVGVVCSSCRGTGESLIKYKPFAGRHKTNKAPIVFQRNMGRVLGPESKGGLPYKDWFDGKPFPKYEDRENYCPAWWYQNMDYKKKPSWDECIGCGSFTDCKSYPKKSKCWERFDRENKK